MIVAELFDGPRDGETIALREALPRLYFKAIAPVSMSALDLDRPLPLVEHVYILRACVGSFAHYVYLGMTDGEG